MKILVVEDIEPIRKALVQQLVEIPEVEVVWEGPHDPVVVEVAQQTRPDVVLLNILVTQLENTRMAFKVLEELKHIEPKPVIIALGDKQDAYHQALYEQAALKHGADLFLDRTHEMETIPQMVKSFIENPPRP